MYKDLYTDAYYILYKELPAGDAQNKKVMERVTPIVPVRPVDEVHA